jgi:hypothetical protein
MLGKSLEWLKTNLKHVFHTDNLNAKPNKSHLNFYLSKSYFHTDLSKIHLE